MALFITLFQSFSHETGREGMSALCFLVNAIVNIIFYIILANVILSWLLAFDIINRHNRFVFQVYDSLEKALAPLLNPIRRIMPNLGGLDLSPIVLLLGLQFLQILFVSNVCYRI